MSAKIYKEVTDRICAALEAGVNPWSCPWNAAGTDALPRNAVSERAYSGINTMLLWIEASCRNWTDQRFLTFKQAKELGGTVRKGERGTRIVFWGTGKGTKIDKKSGEEVAASYKFLRAYTVFNVAQCDGLGQAYQPQPLADPSEDARRHAYAAADRFLTGTGAEFKHHSSEAYYVPSTDEIYLPRSDQFEDIERFYTVAFHELGHWTGHQSRLDRDLSKRFKLNQRAAEELIAEMTAAYVAGRFGMSTEIRHAEYLATWLEVLRDDNSAIVTAASKASKAADFLFDIQPQEARKAA